MKSLLRLLLKTHFKPNCSKVDRTVSGFTLIELLVAMIITFLILTPLLGFVVDVLNTDRKEQVKSNTEQEIQSALDFIAQDLGQAIYIYDKTGVDAILDSLPNATNGTPILVFWKRQLMRNLLPESTACTPNATTGDDCLNDTYVYSLVAYYLKQDNTDIWCQPAGGTCPARITRYQYRDGIIDTTANPPAYFPATDLDRGAEPDDFKPFSLSVSGNSLQEKMNQWPLQEDNGTVPTISAPPANQVPVLVNYIDTNTVTNVATDTECLNALGGTASVIVSPTNGNGFYACVDSSKTVARVTIRGSALRKMQSNATYNSNNSAFFPTASVQVQGLGVLGQ
ncbi:MULTISPECIES: hormogonium polysaccharide secretion pseudopilin HpsC [Kamptonema]|uniref:hormogonium polysaccharide secretion pseudopilin HpsC n=1 Tax=Kamptonema TaxID=1501433 RepID=UPI0001DAC2E1|nr:MULTISPECIES: hormogonium polysaccharide secretion pseudopilin HpsC [Kamptonema]CBN57283.1 conserved hypothetical protein [Kamptonema sp. PCC 6506]